MISYYRKYIVSVAILLNVETSFSHLTTIDCSATDQCSATNASTDSEDCYLFLAPSSIPGAGMGIFSTKSFGKGSAILSSDYGPLIPIPDGNAVHDHWIGLFNNYIWGQYSGASDQLWYEAEAVTDFQPGLGIFPNFHTYLLNLGWDHPPGNLTYDSTPEGPGLGAVSEYVGRTFTAERDIDAGDELFLDYGEQYLEDRSPDMDFVPRRADFEMAAGIIKSLSFEIGLDDEGKNKTRDDAAETLAAQTVLENALHLLRKSLEETFPRVASLIPRTSEELRKVASLGKSIGLSLDKREERSPYGIALAKSNLQQRDVEWLKENGICLDNIKAGESLIPHAGRGAKARRDIAKGDLIVPMPLLHINDEEELYTYKVHTGRDGNFIRDRNDRAGSQLLLNYCFGSSLSSLLLCPVTNGILANHCSDGCKSPNAELRWSKDETTQSWLNLPLTEIVEKRTRGLSFDLVATRNIGTDEEIFIDYGTAWLHAWDEHVTKWENRTVGNIATVSDQFTVCHYWEEDDSEDANLNDIPSGIDWTQLEDSVFLELFSTDGSRFEMHKSGSYWPCSILDDDGNDLTVRIFQSRWHDTTQWEENNIPRILTNYPTRSVNSFFKPYKSPLHSPGAFRHFVDLPLGLIPKHWHDERVETPLTRYKLGERVELRDKNSDSWLPGTIIDDESISVLLDDVDIIETDVSPNDLRWPTQILHLAASGHPFH